MAHANFEFGETNGRCDHCDSRTVLVSLNGSASVDQEPFESGEYAEDSPEAKQGIEIPDDVELHDSITGHYCIRCNCLTTLCINPPPRQKYSEIDPEVEALLFVQRMKDRGITVTVQIGETAETEILQQWLEKAYSMGEVYRRRARKASKTGDASKAEYWQGCANEVRTWMNRFDEVIAEAELHPEGKPPVEVEENE